MVYVVTELMSPHGKNAEVAKKWFESLKKFPPDPSIGKTLNVLIRATDEGIHVLGIGQPAEGKLEEFIKRTYEGNEMYTTIEGVKYEIKTYLDYKEAYKVLGMEPPKEI